MPPASLNGEALPNWITWDPRTVIVILVLLALLGILQHLREGQRLRIVQQIVRDRPHDQITIKERRWGSTIKILPTSDDDTPTEQGDANPLPLDHRARTSPAIRQPDHDLTRLSRRGHLHEQR